MLYLYLNWLGYISCAWPMFDCWWIYCIFSCFSLLWHFFCMSLTCVNIRFILALKDVLVKWGNITIFQDPHPGNYCLTYILRFQSLWYYGLASEWSLPVFQGSTSQENRQFFHPWEKVRNNTGHWKAIQEFKISPSVAQILLSQNNSNFVFLCYEVFSPLWFIQTLPQGHTCSHICVFP